MPRYSTRNPSKQDRIRELHAKGLTPATIAARLGVSQPTVYRALTPDGPEKHRAAQAKVEARKGQPE
jgi:DNA invertase Pin-like site-specific DNA recombinase